MHPCDQVACTRQGEQAGRAVCNAWRPVPGIRIDEPDGRPVFRIYRKINNLRVFVRRAPEPALCFVVVCYRAAGRRLQIKP